MRDKKETKTLPAKKDACQKRKNLKLQTRVLEENKEEIHGSWVRSSSDPRMGPIRQYSGNVLNFR